MITLKMFVAVVVYLKNRVTEGDREKQKNRKIFPSGGLLLKCKKPGLG